MNPTWGRESSRASASSQIATAVGSAMPVNFPMANRACTSNKKPSKGTDTKIITPTIRYWYGARPARVRSAMMSRLAPSRVRDVAATGPIPTFTACP